MNEVSPHSLHGLGLGIAATGRGESGARSPWFRARPGARASAAAGAQVVIADPPRKGLDPSLRQYLGEHPPERFLYVSCGLESFLDDTVQLTSPGRLRLTALTAFNLLPFTEHVETVARFERC